MKKPYIAVLVVVVLAAAAFFYFQRPAHSPELGVEGEQNSDMFALSPDDLPVVSEDVAYFGNVKGFLARPEMEGTYPGVVMMHEWWGLNDNIKTMAKELAKEGYAVLAVDLFEGTVAATADEARKLTGGIKPERAVQNMKAAAAYLRNIQKASKIASMGWCFGGGQSLQFSLSGETLDATVIYYGSLVTDAAKLSPLKWPVLGVFGSEDKSIPVSSVQEFKSALDSRSIVNQIEIYNGVGHGFANPSGANYAARETNDAWEKTVAFLGKYLK